jgi:hypothetical protein
LFAQFRARWRVEFDADTPATFERSAAHKRLITGFANARRTAIRPNEFGKFLEHKRIRGAI